MLCEPPEALVGHADHAPGGQHGPAGVACVDRGVDLRRQQLHPAVRAALMLDARDHAARDAEGVGWPGVSTWLAHLLPMSRDCFLGCFSMASSQ